MLIIEMTTGKKITIEMDYVNAPNTAKNFVWLASKGYYNGLIFHRVIKGFMIQGGDPKGTGEGGPSYTIKGEFKQNGFKNELKHLPGVISMARTMDPNSAGSQFFIMHKAAPHLDGAYAAFGKVVDGMDVVNEIAIVPTGRGDKPLVPQQIKSISIINEPIEEPVKF